MVGWYGFPSASGLPSPPSAAAFRRFIGTSPSSDFSRLPPSGLRPMAFPAGPSGLSPLAVTGDLPVLVLGVSAHARFLDSARSGGHCHSAYPAHVAFPVLRHGRHLGDTFEARWLACTFPCQRFDRLLAEPAA